MTKEQEAQLFGKINALLNGVSLDVAANIAINLLVVALRQSKGDRSKSEAIFDEMVGRGKGLLMDQYDPVTGKLRSVVPVTHVLNMPFHVEDDSIFPTRKQ